MPDVATPPRATSMPDKLLERLNKVAEDMVPRADFDALKEVTRLNEQNVANLQRGVRDRSLSLPGAEDYKDQWSWSRAVLACHPDHRYRAKEIAPFEMEVSEQTRKANAKELDRRASEAESQAEGMRLNARATNVTNIDSAGGFLVPMQLLDRFYEIFYATLVLDALGVTKLTGLIGESIEVPKETAGTTAYMVPENSTTGLLHSEQTFGQLILKMHEVVATGSYSQRLLRLSNPSIDALIEKSFAQKAARKVEQQVLTGKGSNGEVRGILTGAGGTGNNPHLEGTLQDVADQNLANGSHTPTPNILIDFEGVIEDADALGGKLGFLCHPKVLRKLRKDTANQSVWPTPLSRDMIKELTGWPWLATTQLPTNLSKSGYTNDGSLAHLIFGNWEDLLLAMWGGFEVRRSDVAYSPISSVSAFHSRLVHVLGSQLFDSGVIRSASLVASNEVNYT